MLRHLEVFFSLMFSVDETIAVHTGNVLFRWTQIMSVSTMKCFINASPAFNPGLGSISLFVMSYNGST